jgi:hypothetical protein
MFLSKEQRDHSDRVRQQSEQTQQTFISQAPISTPLMPYTSPDGGKATKRETKIATHASTLLSTLAKVKEDETSEKSIKMPDRKSQPSKCGICKEAFMSHNALFKHLDEKHKFCRE